MQILSVLLFSLSVFAGTYSTHMNEMNGFENKVETLERKIRKLVHEMSQTKDKAKIQEITHEIVQDHEEMKKNIRRAEKIKYHLRFEHPEKGESIEIKYSRLNAQRLRELENELGLDKILSQLKMKVESTFPEPKKPVEDKKSAPFAEPSATPQERIKVTK